MRLIELDPHWIAEEGRQGQGIHFECPHCRETRIGVYFKNPIDGGTPAKDRLLWQRAGDTFETLTLTPSIDASKFGHWHGHVTNGEII